jgi:hypothetical protein
MSYLRFLCLFAYKWCPPHIVLWFLFCLSSSYVPMLPISVDCAFYKSPGSDRGKINLHKKENIYCHLRYGYLVGVSVFPP